MDNLLLVSNRLPVKIERKKGELQFHSSVSGLATGLSSFYSSYNSRWIGWSGIPIENLDEKEKKYIEKVLKRDFSCRPIFLSQKQVKNYYNGFCNKTIWPILLYFIQYVVYDRLYWDSYEAVNKIFCDAVIKIAQPNDIIWIHDYHLMLLPKMIREKMPEARLGFFLHTPFPSFEIFRLLPWRKEIIEGLLGSDLMGFQTYDYVRHFLNSVHRLRGYECALGKITTTERVVKVDTFPIGIDYKLYSKSPWDAKVQREKNKWKKKLYGKRIILSVDRMDYTKGIPQRLEAFDKFLEKYPEYRKKIFLILITVPSREQLGEYKLLKKQVDELVGKINGEFGSIEWTPILYIHRSLTFHQLVALYSVSDVALVSSLRDGMNLVAKEYIATKTDNRGVLVLSETAGAAKELGEAVLVNPNNIEDIVEGLRKALTMPEVERIKRNESMQKRIERYDIIRWAEEFIKSLKSVKDLQKEMKAKIITPEIKKRLINSYKESKKRLLILDYDGTLVPFFEKPEDAKPPRQLLNLLKKLADNKRNKLVLISGRDISTLERWFGRLDIAMSAEHGAWIKYQGREWELIEPLTNEWKQEIRPVLESFEDITPGSQVEEKDFSLAWHYRKVDTELGLQRVRELIDDLTNFSETFNLQVKQGSKTVEVKNGNINKGRAALRWIDQEQWDFILAIGDEWTDEDIFSVLPKNAHSIKVGLYPSQAKYNLETSEEVQKLLKELV